MTGPDAGAPDRAVADRLAEVVRDEHGRVLSVLIRELRDFDLAEDALADAVAEALPAWTRDGIPDRPGGWLLTVARRRGIDRMRRADAARRAVAKLDLPGVEPAAEDVIVVEPESAVVDERLRLMFTCCHPALSVEAQIALTLRTIAGLTAGEIARAFLVSEAAMERRLGRARAKIRDANIPYRIPPDHQLPDRLGAVLHVIELVFNEGYLPAIGDALVHDALCEEAIRLARVLLELVPDEAEAMGLLALLEVQHARRRTRVDATGALVTLEHQDRARWDHAAIAAGATTVETALRRGTPGRYQLQAAIAALHGTAATWGDTDWPQIAALYGELLRLRPTPVVALNRAVAVAMAQGPEAGLALLAELDDALAGYHLLHATRGELSLRAGRAADAVAAFDRALESVTNETERAHLVRRRAEAANA